MARTFDPVGAALVGVGHREEALGLLEQIVVVHGGTVEELARRLGDRTCGFLRGMRDRLLMDEAFAPSSAQMNWLRGLAGEERQGPHRGGRGAR